MRPSFQYCNCAVHPKSSLPSRAQINALQNTTLGGCSSPLTFNIRSIQTSNRWPFSTVKRLSFPLELDNRSTLVFGGIESGKLMKVFIPLFCNAIQDPSVNVIIISDAASIEDLHVFKAASDLLDPAREVQWLTSGEESSGTLNISEFLSAKRTGIIIRQSVDLDVEVDSDPLVMSVLNEFLHDKPGRSRQNLLLLIDDQISSVRTVTAFRNWEGLRRQGVAGVSRFRSVHYLSSVEAFCGNTSNRYLQTSFPFDSVIAMPGLPIEDCEVLSNGYLISPSTIRQPFGQKSTFFISGRWCFQGELIPCYEQSNLWQVWEKAQKKAKKRTLETNLPMDHKNV